MHKARWRERRAPGGKGGGKRGRGTERDMPPEAATADVCTSVATVGSYAAGSAPRGLGLRPGQSGLRASLASQLRAAFCLFLPAHFLIRLGDPCTSLGGGKGGTVYSLVG